MMGWAGFRVLVMLNFINSVGIVFHFFDLRFFPSLNKASPYGLVSLLPLN